MSYLELIAIDLTAKYMGIDSDRHLFRLSPKELSLKIDHTVYNRSRRKLFAYKIRLQHKMSNILNGDESYFIVDSIPLEVCKISRCRGIKICTEQDYSSPNKGYCASQSMRALPNPYIPLYTIS